VKPVKPNLEAQYAEAFAQRIPVAVPEERPGDWQRRSNPWARYYSSLLAAVSPIAIPMGSRRTNGEITDATAGASGEAG